MKENLEKIIGDKLESLKIWVDDVKLEERDNLKFLNVVLDSNTIIDLNRVTEASEIINPLIDELDLIEDSYILDIYAKPKGDNKNE